ncbi:zinc finger protein 92 [Clonorchis sinensis]|uniref:Zinc finger protein 92 n=1 Tax=Clonorchis sinensis TaxID=79923 RepID=G7YU93_CLOSI|nr:zinc finger protein 92 [Clonorchis sinensis]
MTSMLFLHISRRTGKTRRFVHTYTWGNRICRFLDDKEYEKSGTSGVAVTSAPGSGTEPHAHVISSRGSDIPNIRYQCMECSRVFRFSCRLNEHLRTHLHVRPHMCDFCSSAFKTLKGQKSHMVVMHLGEMMASEKSGTTVYSALLNRKLHPCHVCGKRWPSRGALNEHVRVHTGEKLYTCKVCTSNFKTPSTLTRHSKQCRRDAIRDT